MGSEMCIRDREYVGVDEEEETGRHLNDDDVMKLVSIEEIPEEADEEDEEPSKDVTVFEALESIRILINLFEQSTSAELVKKRTYLDHLWEMKETIHCQAREPKQKKMTDFFKQ